MKYLFALLLLISFIGCSSSEKMMETNNVAGEWVTVSLIMNGQEMPPAAFQNQTLVVTDSTYIFTAESVDKGTVKYTGNKIDIWGKEGPNAGKHITAIYKLEQTDDNKKNDVLTICYNLAGDSYPENFETEGKPMFFVGVFKRK